jgi:hypothetical protein
MVLSLKFIHLSYPLFLLLPELLAEDLTNVYSEISHARTKSERANRPEDLIENRKQILEMKYGTFIILFLQLFPLSSMPDSNCISIWPKAGLGILI